MKYTDYARALEEATEVPYDPTKMLGYVCKSHRGEDSSEMMFFDDMKDFLRYWECLVTLGKEPDEKPSYLFSTCWFTPDMGEVTTMINNISDKRHYECGYSLTKAERNSFNDFFDGWLLSKDIARYIALDLKNKVCIPW